MTYTDQATIEAFLKRSLSADEQTILPLILEVTDSYIESEIGIFGDVAESSRFYTCLLYTFRAHETVLDLVCRLLLEKKQKSIPYIL